MGFLFVCFGGFGFGGFFAGLFVCLFCEFGVFFTVSWRRRKKSLEHHKTYVTWEDVPIFASKMILCLCPCSQ